MVDLFACRKLALVLTVILSAVVVGPEIRGQDQRTPRLTLHVDQPSEGDPRHVFRVTGLTEGELSKLRDARLSDQQWKQLLSVFIGQQQQNSLPMFGTYQVGEASLEFRPRYPLRPGASYRFVFRPSQLPQARDETAKALQRRYDVPPVKTDPTFVTHVYPSRDVLPENQLKFYVYFSAPMSRGEAYERLHLLDGTGQAIQYPFLELHEELWDTDGQRFTLLFDPGRVKRDLKPRRDLGPPLEQGKAYTLVVDQRWEDANSRPLKAEYRKSFRVGPPDETQPDPANWKIYPPAGGTRDPLTIQFEEPLDHAMLHRVLVVRDGQQQRVLGRVQVDRQETRWQFHPRSAWSPGSYDVQVETTLEDLAGNSPGRPFEVDVFKSVDREVIPQYVELPFEVQ